MVQPTRLDYCQYLLSSPINYTLTHLADHNERFSHDMINRYLAGERIPPRLVSRLAWYGKMSNQTLCKQPKDMSSLMTRFWISATLNTLGWCVVSIVETPKVSSTV